MAYAADKNIDGLDALTSLDDTDVLIAGDQSDADRAKKITKANLVTDLASTTQTLTNKTIDADGTGNSITNIEDANIKAGAAIDATKIGAGGVTSTEFGYIGGLTSDAQTQINAKGTGTVDTSGTPVDNDFAKFTDADTIEGRSYSEVRTDLNVEDGAEANNISDVNATDLTDSGETSLHYHDTDRARANHTGTQAASTISDFDTEVANNSAVAANTAKVTNATHSGEVTGSGALTITDNVVDEANLKLDEAATNDYVLTADSAKSGGMKWAAASSGFADPMTTRGDVIVRDATNTTARLGLGTNGQYLKSDGTDISWATIAGGGDVSKVGTPVDNQVGVWTGDGTLEGTTAFTFSGTSLAVIGTIIGTTSIGTNGDVEVTGNIKDRASDLDIIGLSATASAVNEVTVKNNITANAPELQATGTDTNISLNLVPKGTGEIQVAGEKVIDETDTASVTAAGIVELATGSETTTGTDATRAVTPDGLAGSDYGKRVVEFIVIEGTTDTAVADKAGGSTFRVPAEMNGWNLVDVEAHVETAGTTGTTDIQIRNVTQTADMLSTKITIDSAETDSSTAATPPVIDTANDDVATADKIAIDLDAVSTTAAKGLTVTMTFQLP